MWLVTVAGDGHTAGTGCEAGAHCPGDGVDGVGGQALAAVHARREDGRRSRRPAASAKGLLPTPGPGPGRAVDPAGFLRGAQPDVVATRQHQALHAPVAAWRSADELGEGEGVRGGEMCQPVDLCDRWLGKILYCEDNLLSLTDPQGICCSTSNGGQCPQGPCL